MDETKLEDDESADPRAVRRPIGPKHLRILEQDFAKPQSRNDGARELEPKDRQ